MGTTARQPEVIDRQAAAIEREPLSSRVFLLGGYRWAAAVRAGDWINRERIRVYGTLLFILNLVAISVCLASGFHRDPGSQPVALDFPKCVAASSLALKGRPQDAYNDAKQWEAEKAVTGNRNIGFEVWDYPPDFLLMVLPLSLMDYDVAFLTWNALTLAAYLLVVGMIAKKREALLPACAFPALIMNLIPGQNGMLTMALLAGGLLLLENRPIWAGVMFGLLTYKPQFGILIPIVLIATRNWRPFVSATVTASALVVLTAMLFGISTWTAVLRNVPSISTRLLVVGDVGFGKIHSVFGAARLWNASVTTALTLQMIFSLAAGTIVVWIWRRPVSPALKSAALATATLMVTPYVMDYDLIVLAAPIAWLSVEGLRDGFVGWEKSILVVIFLFPPLGVLLATKAAIPLTPAALSLLLAIIAVRVSRSAGQGSRVEEAAAPPAPQEWHSLNPTTCRIS
jgi:alpha-1,2-mannosyltransferase